MSQKGKGGHIHYSIHVAKTVVFFYLIAALILAGWGSYYLLRQYEMRLQFADYDNVVESLGSNAQKDMNTNFRAKKLLAQVVGKGCATSASWPNCGEFSFDYFADITDTIMEGTDMRTLSINVFLEKDEISSFEAFAYNYFEEQGHGINDSMPLGLSSIGEGIRGRNTSDGGSFYHTVEIFEGGWNPIFVPIFLVGNLESNKNAVMYNVYTEPVRVRAIDDLIKCVDLHDPNDCGAITDMLKLVQDTAFRPAALTFYPIFPYENKTDLVGVSVSVLNWDDILSDHVPEDLGTIEAVITSDSGAEGNTFTYTVVGSVATLKGEGDLHDGKYANYKRSFPLQDFAYSSMKYSLHIYPTDEYANRSITTYPLFGSLVSVLAIIITSLVVFGYDFMVTEVAREQGIVLETKRLFVRYISHEVRTPLNTVHLGLIVLRGEINNVLASAQKDPEQPPSFIAAMEEVASWLSLIDDVESNSDIALCVLNDLINYDKIVMGSLMLELTVVPIFSLLTTICKPFNIQALEKNIRMRILCDPEDSEDAVSSKKRPLVVMADCIKLGQVIRNLVSNALKFTPRDGDVTIIVEWIKEILPVPSGSMSELRSRSRHSRVESRSNIDMELYNHVGRVQVSVQDTGVGMTEENIVELFREGVQFHANQLQHGGGSGLGLWVAQGFVKQHVGGSLVAESKGLGHGSVFKLGLPVYLKKEILSNRYTSQLAPINDDHGGRDVELGISSANIVEQIQESSSYVADVAATQDIDNCEPVSKSLKQVSDRNGTGKKVLVVDDSAMNRKMLCRLLRNRGYECDQGDTGQACLDMVIESAQVDDIMFPLKNECPTNSYGINKVVPEFKKQNRFIVSKWDFVLMDFEMPIMNGPTATKELRNMGFNVPIIGITGNVLPQDVEMFLSHGANAVLAKPLTLLALEEAIEKINQQKYLYNG